ncbi:hypothetical protein [Nguyenibacter vanlangensis]|nr:hypothetical protein [Nguyenibacter vanlangensis]
MEQGSPNAGMEAAVLTPDQRHRLAAALEQYLDADRPGQGVYGLLRRAADAAIYDQVRGWGCQPHPPEAAPGMIHVLIPPEDMRKLLALADISEQQAIAYLVVHLPRAVRNYVLKLPMHRPGSLYERAKQHFPCVAADRSKG